MKVLGKATTPGESKLFRREWTGPYKILKVQGVNLFVRHVVTGKERTEHHDHCSRISYLPEDNGVDPRSEDPDLLTQNEDTLQANAQIRKVYPHKDDDRDFYSGHDVGRDVPLRFSHRGRILKSTRKPDFPYSVPAISRGEIGTYSGTGTSCSQGKEQDRNKLITATLTEFCGGVGNDTVPSFILERLKMGEDGMRKVVSEFVIRNVLY